MWCTNFVVKSGEFDYFDTISMKMNPKMLRKQLRAKLLKKENIKVNYASRPDIALKKNKFGVFYHVLSCFMCRLFEFAGRGFAKFNL